MIVRMKKVFLVTQSKDAHNTLEKVRKLGVLHIEHLKDVKGDKVSSLNNDLALLDQALSLLSQVDKEEGKLQSTKNTLEWPVLARHIIDLHKRLQQLNDYSLTLSSKITLLKDWGDFDWKDILSLRLNGIFTRFYKLSLEDIAKLPEDVYLIKLNKQAGIYNCVIMSEGERDIPFKEEVLPKESLSKLQERAKQDLKAISLLKKELEGNVIYLDFLRNTRKRLTKELEFFEVLSGMAQEPGLIYIKGYIPCDQQSQIEKNARKEGWGLLVTDPSEEDMVPTLVRNPRWLNIISPVFKIIEVVPGYKELDISLWFL
ncbi:MAG: hypothetical protein FJZ12_04590, partial [Candidatus Omnitrophica bacterium]|nr:hypothetical protein [Candidatus Omnitrophota bacterium]